MLARFTLIDYDREMALVAVHKQRRSGQDGEITETERIIGVSRYITNPDQTSCEFSLVVADDFAGQGLGSRLMLSIMDVARDKGLTEIIGLVLTTAHNMRNRHAQADAQRWASNNSPCTRAKALAARSLAPSPRISRRPCSISRPAR
jgi:GNAT superfamily N-acetyltransferase